MGLCRDVLVTVVLFCPLDSVVHSLSVCKEWLEVFSSKNIWIVLARRDHPQLRINSKKDYIDLIPTIVDSTQLNRELKKSEWAQKWLQTRIINFNGREDEMVRSCVISIIKSQLVVKKLRRLFDMNKTLGMDWKIAVNKAIEEYLQKAEDDYSSMEHHVSALTGKSTLEKYRTR